MRTVYTYKDFYSAVDSGGVVVCLFGREGCGYCSAAVPKIETLEREYSDVTFIHVDVSRLPFKGAERVPTYVVYFGGEARNSMVGTDIKKLISSIEEYRRD